jgi:signal transduction histidine kinase/DNA-binding response OmpR family regulator/CHASE3 domain sensor protein
MQPNHIKALQAGFGLSLLILIATSAASFISIRNLIYSAGEVNHTNSVLKQLENAISYTKDAETGQRGYFVTRDSAFLDPYWDAADKALQALDTVSSLTTDNPLQQEKLTRLRNTLAARFDILDESIRNNATNKQDLLLGKAVMDSARIMVNDMQTIESTLLAERTKSLEAFSNFTPVIIIIAALIALFITIYFYRKVSENFKDKIKLADELQKKDIEISQRIHIIKSIAADISRGQYKIRLNVEQNDNLGEIATSLNAMANSLDKSFTELEEREWLQRGISQLNDHMAGEKDVYTLCASIIGQLAEYTNSQIGAFYHSEADGSLVLKGGYAYKADSKNDRVAIGEGIVGQCAQSRKEILTQDISADDFMISFGSGNLKPKNIIAIPVFFENRVKAVIELGSIHNYSESTFEYLKSVSHNIGISLNTSVNRAKLQELLEETQAQSEELQAQHSELESLNTELEAQAEKLQASEEELKVQQEELTEANQELQERSKMLEEKNDLVISRNIEIQKKSEELALNAKYKSEFLANMSHELRTPLNSILLLSRLLGENNDSNLRPDQVEFAKVIQSSGNSLLLLIDDILDLSKIESGKMELEYETVALEEIARDINMTFAPIADEKKIRFTIQMEKEAPVAIETDKLRLEQIIKNLASNAIKFTNEGFVEVSILNSPTRKDYLDIKVKDTGIGIPAEKQELIFEAFQQADGSTRRKYGGTGLGLSISRQLAVLLKGDISLESESGGGSTFTLSIPKNKQAADEAAAREEDLTEDDTEEIITPAVTAPTPSSGEYIALQIPEPIPDDRDSLGENDKVILIVEDDTAFANALLEFTRKKGYKGLIAVRGDHGIELAKQYRPIGILLDIQLPIRSGWEVMAELKADKLTRHIPVHIMSSFEVKKQSLLSGAIDFINKPMAFERMDNIFRKIEFYLQKDSKKVLIIEDNSKHAEALSYFLGTHQINSVISNKVDTGLESLQKNEVDCVILDMGIPDIKAYETLETLKINKGMENVPVIIFTGKSLSRSEEARIKKYADSIVVKTAHSYRRILDEVSLFLHLMEESKQKENGKTGKSQPLAEVLQTKRVLIADDDVRNIFSLTRALEQHQMQVTAAIDGKEALAALEKNPDTDIILMDMMMPEMDGYETITRIRKHPKWKNLPIIAVTAKAMTGDREKCIQAGASDYISKPVDLDQLISLLRIWLYDSSAKK